ncbi:uncharacterized protein ACRADG_007345 [Cochliomyia hominivorax]
MRIFIIIFILSAIVGLTIQAAVVKRDVEDFGDDDDSTEGENDIDGDNNEGDDDEQKDLPIASIKSRAIAMDRELCRELSRYHPHHPRCQLYCEKLNHWMGMCRRDSCHCYS